MDGAAGEDDMKNLVIRALTGAIYVLLLVGSMVYSPVTSFVFFGLVAAFAVVEFGKLMNRHAGAAVNLPISFMAAFILVAAVWLQCIGSESCYRTYALYGLLLIYLMVSELYKRAADPLRNWAYAFAAQLYVALPFALLPMLSVCYVEAQARPLYQWIYPLALFIFIWSNDTGAYLFGCGLSRYIPYKLFPRISPKKSWVGSIGGGLLTLLASVLVWHFIPGSLALWKWMGFALVVVVFGTLGDLVESLLKRQLGIKDSGRFMPGHGGLLDRFDSALLSIPAVIIYLLLVQEY